MKVSGLYIKLLLFYATSVLSFTVCKEFTYNDFFTANAHTNVELKELAQGNATVQRHIMVKALLQNCILMPPRNEFCLFYAVKCVPK